MIPKIVAMVRCKNNHCIVHLRALFEIFQQTSDLIIQFLNKSHIGWTYDITDLLTRECLVYAHIGPSCEKWMVRLFFCFRSVDLGKIGCAIHIIIRRWNEIGPVGFYVAQMTKPLVVVLLLDKIDTPCCQPGGF